MTPGELRAQVFERDGYRCKWPGCDVEVSPINPLECAHLNHRGMGGYVKANTEDNAVALCKFDHSILDGREGIRRTICRIRIAYVAWLQDPRSRTQSHASTPPATVTESGGGRSDPAPMSRPSSIESKTAELRPPHTSTIRTTTPSITGPRTSKDYRLENTGIDMPRSTTRPHGVDTRRDTAPQKSVRSSESTPPLSPAVGETWDTASGQSEMVRRPSTVGILMSSESERCTWPGCVLPGSPMNSEQRERWSSQSCETSAYDPTPPDAPLCGMHSDIVLDGRTGQGKLRYELCGMLKAVVGIA